METITRAFPSSLENLEIYPYTFEMIAPILDLVIGSLGNSVATRKTTDYWHWKHHLNPFGESSGLCAWDDKRQKVVGLRVFMRWEFTTVNGERLSAVRAVDTATDSDYRRRGIFSTLTRYAIKDLDEEGVHFIFNTPNKHTSLPGYLKMGWQVVDSLPMYIKPLHPLRLMLKIFRGVFSHEKLTQPDRCFTDRVITWPDFVSHYRSTLPAFVEASEANRKRVGIRSVRDMKYLQWRYGQHPHIDYAVYYEQDGSELIGFATLRPNIRYNLREMVLDDIFLREPDLQLGKRLITNLARNLDGDYLVGHYSSGSFEREILKRCGFFRVPRRRIILVARPLKALQHDVLDPTNWDISFGDLDLF